MKYLKTLKSDVVDFTCLHKDAIYIHGLMLSVQQAHSPCSRTSRRCARLLSANMEHGVLASYELPQPTSAGATSEQQTPRSCILWNPAVLGGHFEDA